MRRVIAWLTRPVWSWIEVVFIIAAVAVTHGMDDLLAIGVGIPVMGLGIVAGVLLRRAAGLPTETRPQGRKKPGSVRD